MVMEGKACDRGSFSVFSIAVEHYVLLNFGRDLFRRPLDSFLLLTALFLLFET